MAHSSDIYQSAILKSSASVVLLKVTEQNNILDQGEDAYLVSQVNHSFETLTNLRSNTILDTQFISLFVEDQEKEIWQEKLTDCLLQNQSVNWTYLSRQWSRWLDIQIEKLTKNSENDHILAVYLYDVTSFYQQKCKLEELYKITDRYYSLPLGEFDYGDIAADARNLAEAKFCLVNIFDLENNKSTTESIAGLDQLSFLVRKAVEKRYVGHQWEIRDFAGGRLKQDKLIRMGTLHDIAQHHITSIAAGILIGVFDLGTVYSIALMKQSEPFGVLIFIMHPGQEIPDSSLLEIFARQISLFL